MAVPLSRLLGTHIVNERISRVRVTNDLLQNAFGMQFGGSNVRKIPSRDGSYDVFNDTRAIATATTPGGHAATVARQPIGNVQFKLPRTAEKMPLLMEELIQLRPIGGQPNMVDEAGEQYIFEQERVFKQRFVNLREFQIAAMLRGSYTYTATGSEFTHAFSGGSITINYRIPTGNKQKLDMLGAGDIIGTSWDNTAAPIIRDLLAISSAFEQLIGRGLKDIYCTSVVWGYVITNTEVRAMAGSDGPVWTDFTRDETNNEYTARLKGCPWITWHIKDHGLEPGGTFTKLFEDDHASFVSDMGIGSEVVSYYVCPEPVVDPATNRQSFPYDDYFWHKIEDDPVSYETHGRRNGLPILKVPAAIAYGLVKY